MAAQMVNTNGARPPAANFLNLPRELRDEVYYYVAANSARNSGRTEPDRPAQRKHTRVYFKPTLPRAYNRQYFLASSNIIRTDRQLNHEVAEALQKFALKNADSLIFTVNDLAFGDVLAIFRRLPFKVLGFKRPESMVVDFLEGVQRPTLSIRLEISNDFVAQNSLVNNIDLQVAKWVGMTKSTSRKLFYHVGAIKAANELEGVMGRLERIEGSHLLTTIFDEWMEDIPKRAKKTKSKLVGFYDSDLLSHDSKDDGEYSETASDSDSNMSDSDLNMSDSDEDDDETDFGGEDQEEDVEEQDENDADEADEERNDQYDVEAFEGDLNEEYGIDPDQPECEIGMEGSESYSDQTYADMTVWLRHKIPAAATKGYHLGSFTTDESRNGIAPDGLPVNGLPDKLYWYHSKYGVKETREVIDEFESMNQEDAAAALT